MVIRKPYAFIIKHFRIIHLLLIIPMLYLVMKTKNIVTFFSKYIYNGYTFTATDNLSSLSSNYINIFMYLAVLVILIVFVAIFLLFQKKEKSTKFYNISITYYVIILVLLTTCFSIFTMIENDTLDMAFARIITDISYIVHYSQYIFIMYTVVRGTGFNIKKFNFKNEFTELEITADDNEEIEIIAFQDTYKTKRTIRRFFRELTYYYLENKFIFTIIIAVIVVIIGSALYRGHDVTHIYKENESFAFGNINLKITNSYISSVSKNGTKINNGKTYLILLVDIHNRFLDEREFNYSNLMLNVNNNYIKPTISLANYFTDYGIPYNGSKIRGNFEETYILTYEIDSKDVKDNYTMEAMGKTLNIKPSLINDTTSTNYVSTGSQVDLKNTNLKNTKVIIKSYELMNRYEYTYKYCVAADYCNEEATASISINGIEMGRVILLLLDYNLELDSESAYMYSDKNYQNFFEDFMHIKYKINDREYTATVSVINNYADKLIMKVNSNIANADSIEAVLSFRNIAYNIKLK
ncbi:MAG: hypothetical protein K2J20_00435 [Bacilli bacterium]|nr:hypothetical protein [Bacilli bacterium]